MRGIYGMRIWKPGASPWPTPAPLCVSICKALPQGIVEATVEGTGSRSPTFLVVGAAVVPFQPIAKHDGRGRKSSSIPAARCRRPLSRRAAVAARAGVVQSRRGLDWMNFFIADVQTGFGTFVAFYLAQLGWSQGSVGVVLAAGGLAGVLSQIPGGALADAVTWKRALAALGIVM